MYHNPLWKFPCCSYNQYNNWSTTLMHPHTKHKIKNYHFGILHVGACVCLEDVRVFICLPFRCLRVSSWIWVSPVVIQQSLYYSYFSQHLSITQFIHIFNTSLCSSISIFLLFLFISFLFLFISYIYIFLSLFFMQ